MDTAEIGSKINFWTVTGAEGRWRYVRCDCGNKRRIQRADLVAGRSKGCRECGHKRRIGVSNEAVKVHGYSDTPTQWVWSDMKRRCLSPHRRGYENYGGRGIKVCKRWMTFANFLEDMGPRPSRDHQIDRIDNDGNYTKKNCRWVLKAWQNYNKRNTYRFQAFGKMWTLEQAEKEYGIKKSTLFQRLHTYRMKPEVALTKPVRSM